MLNRKAALDGWRGLAILAVLIGHFTPIPYLNAGRFGVELFFVLSGRLMGEILFVKRDNLLQFYWRRISRIIPTLYVYLIICLFFSKEFFSIDLTIESAVSAATFTYNYLHNHGYGSGIIDHIWSLCIEEHTYLLLGALAFCANLLKIKPWKICFVLGTACIANGLYLTHISQLNYYDVYWRTDTRATGILLGCGLYCCALEKPIWFNWITKKSLILLFILSLVLSLYPVPDTLKYSIGTISLSIILVFIDRLPIPIVKILESRALRFMGIASFSLYIWQQPFIFTTQRLGILNTLACALICGFASFYFIETPCRKYLNKYFSRKQHFQESKLPLEPNK